MEVIKHGIKLDKYSAICKRCSCVFTYQRKDCYWDITTLDYKVYCPQCNSEIYLGAKFID